MGVSVNSVCAAIRAAGLSCTYRDGEFRINYKSGSEDTAYFTNDAQDALDTAAKMVEGLPKPRPVPTLDSVIEALKVRMDARLLFWCKVQSQINDGQYKDAMEAVQGNRYDTDFAQQVAIVSDAIKAHVMK